MYTYLCKFLYAGEINSNILNQVGYMCLIESDSDELDKLPVHRLTNFWKIDEALYEHACDSISLELLSDEDKEKYFDMDIMTVDLKDVD
jgi:hypothetical protein